MRNQGFVNISLIFWMPVILTFLYGTFWCLWFLQQKLRLDNLCHYHVLKSQEALVSRNNQIMSLNPRATSLWSEKKVLNLTIATAPIPIAAAARIKKAAVVGEQMILKTRQTTLFRTSEYESRQALAEMRREFQKLMMEWKIFWGSHSTATGHLQIFPNQSQLRTAIYDTARVYRRPFQHSRLQGIQARWSIPWRNMMPRWLTRWIPIHNQWVGECFSHPHSGGFQWQAAIGVGKH